VDLKTVVLIVIRRWYVVIPLSLAALVFALGAGGSPSYHVDSAFLLVSPVAPDADEGTNPLLQSRSGVNSVANVAAVIMHTGERRAAVADAGLSSDYLFTVANLEPFVTLRVVSDDPEIAQQSALKLAELYVDELKVQQLEFGASAGALVSTQVLEISAPTADYSSVRTTQALYLVGGLLVAFMAAFALEGAAYWRSPKREEFLALFRAELASVQYGPEEGEAGDDAPEGTETPLRAVDAPVADGTEDGAEENGRGSRWSRRRVSVGPRDD
jgi:hypothetical protein